MGIRCGIDLGTTFSAISYYDSYNNRVDPIDLETADGGNLLRSVVYYPDNSPAVVGDTALNAARNWPERVITGIKRSMGTGYRTQEIDGAAYTPQQVSSVILKVLAGDAQIFLGEEVKDVIITVPAYFGDNERAATEEAGVLAGLNVLGLLPEPHAAALAFAVQRASDIAGKNILVYDLGGGTFDVTLIRTEMTIDGDAPVSLHIETLCKEGNASLGGLDWDRALAEIVGEKVMQQHGADVWEDPKNEALLLENCEKAKRNLSRSPGEQIVADMANHQVEVTRSEFEDRTRDLLLQSRMLLEQVMEDAEKQHGIPKDGIDVLLAGGSTRMPMVAEMIQSVTGRKPLRHRNPELLVATGAAYWAHLLQEGVTVSVPLPRPDGKVEPRPVKVSPGGLTDISTYAVGVEIMRPDGRGGWARLNKVIVKAGARYGEVFSKDFATSEDDMTEIPIVLYKGDSEDLNDCERLMTFIIKDLPAGLKAGAKVGVTLGYDDSGILRGRAQVETGHTVDIVYDRTQAAS